MYIQKTYNRASGEKPRLYGPKYASEATLKNKEITHSRNARDRRVEITEVPVSHFNWKLEMSSADRHSSRPIVRQFCAEIETTLQEVSMEVLTDWRIYEARSETYEHSGVAQQLGGAPVCGSG